MWPEMGRVRPEESVYQTGSQEAQKTRRRMSISATMTLQNYFYSFKFLLWDDLEWACKELTQALQGRSKGSVCSGTSGTGPGCPLWAWPRHPPLGQRQRVRTGQGFAGATRAPMGSILAPKMEGLILVFHFSSTPFSCRRIQSQLLQQHSEQCL